MAGRPWKSDLSPASPLGRLQPHAWSIGVGGFASGQSLFMQIHQKLMLVVSAKVCMLTSVELCEYSPESRPLVPTFCVAGNSY
jgi:hypothetical protein